MEFRLPEKFANNTRWLYQSNGKEYGPLSADEILQALRERRIDGDTSVTELETGHNCFLREVRPFSEYLSWLTHQWRLEDADREFQQAINPTVSESRRKVSVIVLVLLVPVLIAAAVGSYIWHQNRSSASVGEEADFGKNKVAKTDTAAVTNKYLGDTKPTVVPGETIQEHSEVAKGTSQLDQLRNESKVVSSNSRTRGPEAIVDPALIADNKTQAKDRSTKPRTKQNPAETAGGSQAGRVTVFESWDEEGEGDSAADSRSIASDRLSSAVRSCGKSAYQGSETTPHTVNASISVHPDGRMVGLSIKVEPSEKVAAVKQCVSASLAGAQVPPFSGDVQTATAKVTID